ncbi:MAG: CYTH domain-containing protein [Vulcanimicrobiota bacterium]
MSQRETEFKYLLSATDYQKVLAGLGAPHRERVFVNRYFTVEDAPGRKDWVLRLRVEGSHRELTLKIGREIALGLFDSMEYSELVGSEQPGDWSNSEPIRVFRTEISPAPLRVQGESQTRRLLFSPPLEVGQVWELDSCCLPGGQEFFELEVETQAPGVEEQGRALKAWLESRGVRPRPSEMTKYARFLGSLESSG